MKEIVTFFLSGKEYGVEVSGMQGIENYVPLESVENAPACLKGIVTIRDEIIPVIDIKQYLILPPAEVTENTKYLVLGTKNGKVACLADGISKIFQASGEDIQNFPILLESQLTEYVDYIARNGNNLVIVINPAKLLSEEEWSAIHEMIEKVEEEKEND